MGEPAEAVGLPQPFGKYRLLREIARGGMAQVFLAVQSGLQGFSKLIVIKRILPEYSRHRSFCEMLLDEARIAATFNHPNVIQVLDVGVADGQYYIAMEYLAGENLRTISRALRARAEGFTLAHALSIMVDSCAGLYYAHTREFGGKALEIVHRDVSPKNIIVTYDGSAKIVDFGIAKATDKIFETRSGVLKGSLPYMSPEQARGEPLDLRSDIFSLGTILYEMTTGRRLFKESSDFHILRKIVTDEIARPSDVVADYPRELEAIVVRALERDRSRRYQSCRQMQQDLDGFIRRNGIEAGPMYVGGLMGRLFADRILAQREAERQGKLASEPPGTFAARAVADPEFDDTPGLATAPTRAEPAVELRRGRKARRRRMVLALGLAGALVAVLAGGLWLRGLAGSSRRRTRSVAAAAPAAPVTAPLPSSPRVQTPSGAGVVTIRFDSTPPGADVLLYGQLLGRTPVDLPVERGGRPMQFVLRLSGYREVVRAVTPDREDRVTATLARNRTAGRRAGGAAAVPAPGVVQDDLVNPFGR